MRATDSPMLSRTLACLAAAVALLVQAKLPSITLPTADLNHQIFSLCPEYYRRSAAEEKRLTSPDT